MTTFHSQLIDDMGQNRFYHNNWSIYSTEGKFKCKDSAFKTKETKNQKPNRTFYNNDLSLPCIKKHKDYILDYLP